MEAKIHRNIGLGIFFAALAVCGGLAGRLVHSRLILLPSASSETQPSGIIPNNLVDLGSNRPPIGDVRNACLQNLKGKAAARTLNDGRVVCTLAGENYVFDIKQGMPTVNVGETERLNGAVRNTVVTFAQGANTGPQP